MPCRRFPRAYRRRIPAEPELREGFALVYRERAPTCAARYSMMSFWRRHRRKIFVAVAALGCGYAIYRQYNIHKQRIIQLERESESQRQAEALLKMRLQNHFDGIQKISETITLPYTMQYLDSRISEELDLSYLTEKLMQGKGQSNAKERLELWERLKILSFVRITTSLWTTTVLFLFVHVQVNILGRYLYLETARGLGSFEELDEADRLDRHSQEEFLKTAEFLSSHSISSVISSIERSASEVLQPKQLRDSFSMTQMHDTILQIMELFMNSREPNSWVSYLIPEGTETYQQSLASSSTGFDKSAAAVETSKLKLLIGEAQSILKSTEFRTIMDISLKKVVEELVQDLESLVGVNTLPLARLLPKIAQLSPTVLEEPSNNKYISIIRGLPEVELFYTLVYTNTA